jgi:hypothetical protein
MKINRIIFGMLAAVTGIGMGCAGYHIGPTNGLAAGERSVQIQFFKNETFEPRLATAVNRAMKREFQKDGTYTLETQSEGDLIVSGKLIEFRRNGVSYKPGDVLTVQDYTMDLSAEITVINRATGEEIFKETLTGTATVRVGNDLTAGQRQVVPIIAGKLAEQAVLHIVDGNWPDPQPEPETP